MNDLTISFGKDRLLKEKANRKVIEAKQEKRVKNVLQTIVNDGVSIYNRIQFEV